MWTRSECKKRGRKSFVKKFWASVAVCFLMAFLVGEYSASTYVIDSYNSKRETRQEVSQHVLGTTKGETISDFANHLSKGRLKHRTWATQLTQNFTNSQTSSNDTFAFMILNSINKGLNGEKVSISVFLAVSSLISMLYMIFIANILRIGECRFFMEKRTYPDTKISRLMFIYHQRKVKRSAWTMLKKWIFTFLWMFTIVGGVIKFYEYRLIPYIVAENPDVTAKEAFVLSKNMMMGQKWKTFVMDCSFIGWEFLVIITGGVLGFFYVNPYRTATYAELYMALRENAKQTGMEGNQLLCDELLVRRGEHD